MPPEDDATRLPQAPESLLAFLRDAETRLDDLRYDIRAVREALEAEQRPKVAAVAEAVPVITGTIHATLPALTGGVGVGTYGWTGAAEGDAPPDQEVPRWLSTVKKYGPPGARVVEFIVRVASLLN